MTEQKKATAATAPTTAPRAPKKLIPRTAPKVAAKPTPATASAVAKTTKAAAQPAAKAVAKPAAKPVAKPVAKTTAKPVAKPTVRKPSALDEINAKNKKAMADALVMAQAVKIAQPLGRPLPPPEPVKAKKVAKPEKPKKAKLVRDSFAMPETEYAQIATLKKRLAGLGKPIKKNELLRGGLATLAALNDAELQAIIGRVEPIKTGRPAKAK